MNRMTTPWGDQALTRFPEDPRDTLRAWDSADEYLLRHLAGAPPADDGEGRAGTPHAPVTAHGTAPGPRDPAAGPGPAPAPADLTGTVAVLGDRWGALTTALAAARLEQFAAGPLVQITDSYLTQRATRANLRRNGAGDDAARLLSVRAAPPGRIDVLLVRVPRSLALLEDQLHRLAPSLHPGTLVVGTGRTTEIHTSTLLLFERILGPTRTTLAERKARLILCTPAAEGTAAGEASPWPLHYVLPKDAGVMSERTVVAHAGIFSAERLDIGTRFLLRHLPERRGPEHVVDLGCGNGVVGTAAALANPASRVTFVDESYAAVASAEETFRRNVPTADAAPAAFVLGDALADIPAGSVDLVLNNPPFHSHQATTDAVAWRMFTGARAALRPGGDLVVVGNRHLGYHAKLRRLFGNCEVVASDPKFVVLRSVKR